MGIGSLLRRIARREGDERLTEARAAFDTLRRDVRALRKELANAHRQMQRAEQQIAQLLALRLEDADAAERLDRLAPVMDFEAGARHARDAIAAARRVNEPFPHLLIAPLLPAGIYGALLEAIPPRVFFAPGRSGFDELRIPPELAPLHAAATWRFFARLVKRAIAPALLNALAEELKERRTARTECEGALVWRDGAGSSPSARAGEGARQPLVRLVLPLTAEGPQANAAVAFVEGAGAPATLPFLRGDRGDGCRYELAISASSGPV